MSLFSPQCKRGIGTRLSALDERSLRAGKQVGSRASTGTPVRIAKSSAIAASIPGVNALEPISPELVLVDPELARLARARLPEIPPRPAPAKVETSTSVVEPSPPALAEEIRPQLAAAPL